MAIGSSHSKHTGIDEPPSSNPLELISHTLCPYVQRAVIVLTEKGVAHSRTYVDLASPPDWFRRVSPLGKVPLLRVDGDVIFESAVICEYLEETHSPPLHPGDPLQRAKHRAWMEYGSAVLDNIWSFYTAPDDNALARRARELRDKFARLEDQLREGPYFSGGQFSLVDAVFGPIFRYFDVFDGIADFGVFDGLVKTRQWRAQLALRPSVKNAVAEDYPHLLQEFLRKLDSALSKKIA